MKTATAVGLTAAVVIGGGYALEHGHEIMSSWNSRHDDNHPTKGPVAISPLDGSGSLIDQYDNVAYNKDGTATRMSANVYSNVAEINLNNPEKNEKIKMYVVCHSGSLVLRHLDAMGSLAPTGNENEVFSNLDLGQSVACMPEGDRFSSTAKAKVVSDTALLGMVAAAARSRHKA